MPEGEAASAIDVRFAISNLNPSRVEGWAFAADRPVSVRLRVDGRVVAEQPARLRTGAVGNGAPACCGFSFEIAPYFSRGPDDPVELAFDLVAEGRGGTAARRRVSCNSALLHYFLFVHLPNRGDALALLRKSLDDVAIALCQPPPVVAQPVQFAAVPSDPLARLVRLNGFLAHRAAREDRAVEFLIDEEAFFDFLFEAFEAGVYRGRVNLVPLHDELLRHCAEVVRHVDGHLPVPRILHHFMRRWAAPDPTPDPTDAYGAALHAFVQGALIGWRLPPAVLGAELLALLRRPAVGAASVLTDPPCYVRLAGRHDEVLRRTFDETVPCDRLGLSLLVLLRLAKDGLHRALLPDALVEALTSPTLIEAEDDRLLDALCRLAGVPGIAGAVRGDALRPGTLGSYRRVAARPAAGAALRVRVIGNLQEDGGLHRNLENSLDALRRAGIAAELVDARVLPAATHLDAAERLVNLFHVSPAALPGFLGLERPDLVAPAYNIGYFMWETEDLPRSFDLGLECVDEVWTGSEFCRAAFARRFSGPVVNMSHAVELPALARPLPRAHFGLPEAAFCFYFAFDAKALFGRKNPLLVARAFRQAFPADEPVVLAIKIRNPDEAGRDPRNRPYWKALRALAAVDGRIRIIAQDFPAAEMRALLETADCYVSLHRAEGFGYTLAEAMLAGKPVIASRYSGNLDFMNDGNALLVDGALSFIRAGDGFGDPGARWFDADPDEAARLMRLVLADPEGARARAAAGQAHVRRDLSPAALGERYARRLGEILKERP